jgi:hypothetical protein
MAIVLSMVGGGLIFISLIVLFGEWDCTKKLEKLFLVAGALLGITVLVVPFMGNTRHLEKHVVIRTDTYEGIVFDEVMKVEYDIYKGDHWWTWNWGRSGEENVRVGAE